MRGSARLPLQWRDAARWVATAEVAHRRVGLALAAGDRVMASAMMRECSRALERASEAAFAASLATLGASGGVVEGEGAVEASEGP